MILLAYISENHLIKRRSGHFGGQSFWRIFDGIFVSGRRRRGGRSLPAAVNRRGHPQLLGKEAVEMGCVVHTDAFRDLLAGKDAAVQQEAGVFQSFRFRYFMGVVPMYLRKMRVR